MSAPTKASKIRLALLTLAILVTLTIRLRARLRERSASAMTPVERLVRSPEADAKAMTLKMAVRLAKAGRYKPARAILEQVLASEPMNASVLNDLGYVVGELGETDKAIEYLRTALQIAPDCAECHTNLGTLLKKQGKNEEAFHEFEQAVKLEPSQADAKLNFAVALEEAGDWARALETYRDAGKLVSDPQTRLWIVQRMRWLTDITEGPARELAGATAPGSRR